MSLGQVVMLTGATRLVQVSFGTRYVVTSDDDLLATL